MISKTENLITSSNEYKAAFEAMPGVCALLKADSPYFTIVAVTDDLVETTGVKREVLYGKGLFEVFQANPNDTDFTGEKNLGSSFNNVISNKKEHKLKVQRYDIPNGNGTFTEKYWQVYNKAVLNEQGEVTYIIHSVIDITEKIKIGDLQNKLNLGEQTYELFRQAPMAICIIRGDEQIIELANKKVLEIWRKDADIIGKPLLEALPEIKGSHFPQLLKDVRLTGKPFYANESHAYFVKNGKEELVYFNFVYQPYYEDWDFGATGVLVVANEVTEQVIARKKAEESEQRYRTLISEAVVATAVYSGKDMQIQYANEAMLNLWGKNESVIGKTISEALPELEGQPFHQLLNHVFLTGETYWGKEDKGEIEVDGQLQTFYFNFTYKALRNAEGEIYGILNMAIDVSEQVLAQKKLQENEANLQSIVEKRTIELERKNQELEFSNAELQQFAYIASHDLQEPLRKIRTFSDIISREVEPDAAIRKYVDKINSSAERMSGLINSLLDYSRLSKTGHRFENVDLNSVLENILSDYELLINQKNANISKEKLPVIQAIPLQINQLFYNLIGNALKFTKREVHPAITIKAQLLTDNEKYGTKQLNKEKDYYKITFEDNGIGFEQNYADKIFTIFQRLNDKTVFSGYGIGLALCKKVTDTHEGVIYAEGKLNEGAKFTVILPVKQ